jgi:hypothetical protein
MTVVSEVVAVLSYQVDETGIRRYRQGFKDAMSKMAADSAGAIQAMRDVASSMTGAQAGLNDLIQLQKKAAGATGILAKGVANLRGALGSLVGFGSVRQLLGDIDAWVQVEDAMRRARNSTQEYTEADRELAKMSRTTRTAYADNADTFMRMQRSMAGRGKSRQDTLDVTQLVALGAVLSGSKGGDRGAIMGSMLKAIEQGGFGAEQLGALPQRLQDAMAKGMGTTLQGLTAQAQGGMISTDRALPALQSQLPALQAEAGAKPASLAGSVTVLNDAWQRFFGTMTGGRSTLQIVTGAVELLADNLGFVIRMLALAGASFGLVMLNQWLAAASRQSGGLLRALRDATGAALGLNTAMSAGSGSAGAAQTFSGLSRSLGPMLRMAAVLTTIYLIGEDISNWLNGSESVLGSMVGGVENWQDEIAAVSTILTFVKDLLGGAGLAVGEWAKQLAMVSAVAYGLWRILSPIGPLFMYLARTAVPMLWRAVTMNPLGRILMLFAMLALAVWQIYENWDVISAAIVALWNAVTGYLKAAWDSVTLYLLAAWDTVTAYISLAWDTLMGLAQSYFLAPLMAWFSALWAFWSGLVNAVVAAFTGDWDAAIAHLVGAFTGLWTFFANIGSGILNVIRAIGDAIQTWVMDKFKSAVSWFKSLLPGQMLSDEQKGAMTDSARALAAQPQVQAFASGNAVPGVPPGSALRGGFGKMNQAVNVQNSFTVNATGLDPVAVGSEVRKAGEGFNFDSREIITRSLSVPRSVEASS